MRNSVKLVSLAGLALLGGAVGVNCSKSGSNPNSGDVKLAVVLPGGVHIDNVTYTVQNSSNATIAGPGTFSVTDPHATISLDIVVPVTPAGDAGDDVVLTATDSLGNSCTGTSPRFPVLAGTNPAVTMTLTCGNGSASGQTGNIGVTATVVEGDHCPNITSGVVAPDEISVLGTAGVAATASDADSGETLTYAWAPATNFASPTSASTTYTCTASGLQTFTLTVTDSHTPTPCSATATFTITCDSTGATGGTTGTGGTVGTGGVVATGGIVGTGGIVATGGIVGTGGVVATGGVMATGGNMGTGGVVACGPSNEDCASCQSCQFSGAASGTCNGVSPPGTGTSAANQGCDGFTNATDKANCLSLLGCIRSAACQTAIHNATADYTESTTYPQPFDDPHPCLCGNIPLATCVGMSSGWTGVCAPQFVAAAAADSLSVGNAYISPTSAVGIAVNNSICDIDNACQSSCVIPQ